MPDRTSCTSWLSISIAVAAALLVAAVMNSVVIASIDDTARPLGLTIPALLLAGVAVVTTIDLSVLFPASFKVPYQLDHAGDLTLFTAHLILLYQIAGLAIVGLLWALRHRLRGGPLGRLSTVAGGTIGVILGLTVGISVVVSLTCIAWRSAEVQSMRVERHGRADLPNVVLISIDSLRWDHVGCYGYRRETTPNIDSLAAEGVTFHQALSTSSWTLPAHMSLLSSLAPEVHGVTTDGIRLGKDVGFLSQRLREAGYLTAAVVGAPYLHAEFGFDRGFDIYDDYTVFHGHNRHSHHGVTSPRTHARAVQWLDGAAGRSFFLFVHYWDVHFDYTPPPPFDTLFDPDYEGRINSDNYLYNDEIHPEMDPRDLEHVIALYDGEIAFTDLYVGRLFEHMKQLGIYERSLIIVTSDHGDEFFEHGQKGHRNNLYDETLRVPLMIRFPEGTWEGLRIDDQVQLVDIAPTVLAYLDLTPLPTSQGVDLMPAIRGDARAVPGHRFADLEDKLKCVRSSRWKYLRQGSAREQELLFDLVTDPLETINVSPRRPSVAATLGSTLDEWLLRADGLPAASNPESIDYDPVLRDRLEALGYLD